MTPRVYGLLAEFSTGADLLHAAQQATAAGYRQLDAFSPFPVEGLAEAIGFQKTRLPLAVLIAGAVGGVGAYLLQYYSAVFDYPLNVGGRPLHSWPAFIPITFEVTVLCAALVAVFGMLLGNGLPRHYHPVFNAPAFAAASQNRFFLCLEASDPLFDQKKTLAFLAALQPLTLEALTS